MKKILILTIFVILIIFVSKVIFAKPVGNYYQDRYFYEEYDQNNGFLDNIIAIFILAVIFLPILVWILPLKEATKQKLLNLIGMLVLVFVISVPFLFILSIRIELTGEINPIIDVAVILAVLVFIVFYFSLAASPATFAYDLVNKTRSESETQNLKHSTFWSLLDRIKYRRKSIISILCICLVVVVLLDVFFFLKVQEKFLEFSRQLTQILFIFGLVFVFFYFLGEFFGYGKINIPSSGHGKSDDIKRLIDNLSITAGIQPPDFKIVSHDKPNAFSICSNFGQPIIYITTALLNLADKNELEAVLGHEITHISSKRVFDYRTISDMLITLRLFSFITFLLFLSTLNPSFIGVWLGIFLYGMIAFGVGLGMGVSSVDPIMRLTNPPFLLVDFISYLIYYALSADEVIYADLESVRLTRYPKPLYSILTKINLYKKFGFTEKLPEEYHYLYFTGEDIAPEGIPMSQPSVGKRLQILEEIDSLLRGIIARKEKVILKCPFCSCNMEEIEAKGHYGAMIMVDRCPNCGSVWFDDWELWAAGDLSPYILDKTKIKDKGYPPKLLCPHCGIKLSRLFDPIIPKGIKIFYCFSCDGNWMKYKYLLPYANYRKSLINK